MTELIMKTAAEAKRANPALMHKVNAVRNRIIKCLRHETPIISATVLQWMYMDCVVTNFTKDEAKKMVGAQFAAIMDAIDKMPDKLGGQNGQA